MANPRSPQLSQEEIDEFLQTPHRPSELRHWADIRLGGYFPGPGFQEPVYDPADRYVTPNNQDLSAIEQKEPRVPERTLPSLHDPAWVAAQQKKKLKAGFRDNYFPVKKLAEGGFGSISIWEDRTGGDNRVMRFRDRNDGDEVNNRRKIVVKDGDLQGLPGMDLGNFAELKTKEDFAEEAEILWRLREAAPNSRNIVNILYPPSTEITKGNVPEIYMEFCEGGDLEMEIWRRTELKEQFEEGEVWWLADCLVRALSVLDCGSENGVSRDSTWAPIVHFDMKPGNVLRGELDPTSGMRQYKLADFGTSKRLRRGRPLSVKTKVELRRKATRGYYTPEQFTERWNFRGWENNGVSGEYSTKTNIYGLGLILWSACTLRRFPIPSQPRISILTSTRGLTYGSTTLEGLPYFSRSLKQTILNCLLERPADRPTLGQLRNIIERESPRFFGNRSQHFDFVIDLSKNTLAEEARQRAEQDETRARIQRRNERERQEREEARLRVQELEEANRSNADDSWDINDLSDDDLEFSFDDSSDEDQVFPDNEEEEEEEE